MSLNLSTPGRRASEHHQQRVTIRHARTGPYNEMGLAMYTASRPHRKRWVVTPPSAFAGVIDWEALALFALRHVEPFTPSHHR